MDSVAGCKMDSQERFAAENSEFSKRFFAGKMKTTLVICHECNNVFLTENGPSPEFASSYCPFCGHKKSPKILKLDSMEVMKNIASSIEADSEARGLDRDLIEKVKYIFDNKAVKHYNIAACTECNNRFIFLHEDREDIRNCCFCNSPVEELVSLIEYESVSSDIENPMGMEKYVNRLFYISLTNGVEGNFVLTDVDLALQKYRFVSMTDNRMAIWIKDSQIIDMFEFLKAPDTPPKDSPDEPA